MEVSVKRSWIIIGGIVVLVLLLAGAAFVGGQLMRQQEQQAQANKSGQGIPVKLVTPAAGMPTAAPDARGEVTSRADNSIFICDPQNELSINPNGSVNEGGSCSPTVEVVVGHDTVLLHDVSALRNPAPSKKGQDIVIQQAIEPGSANDIDTGTVVRAWGTRSGNRLIARTLLYWNRSPQPAATPES